MSEPQPMTPQQIADILHLGFALVPGPDGRVHVVTKNDVRIRREDVMALAEKIKKERGGGQ